MTTKKRLTVNVDAEVIPAAKRYARERGVSLSSLVERSLRVLAAEGEAGEGAGRHVPDGHDGGSKRGPGELEPLEPNQGADTWADRWTGTLRNKLKPPAGDDPRYEYLWYKWRLYEGDDEDQRSAAEQEEAREHFLRRWRSGLEDELVTLPGQVQRSDHLASEPDS